MPARTTPLQQQSIDSATADWTQDVPFAGFDTALGTLTGARFTLAGTVNASFAIENLAPTVVSVGVHLGASMTLQTPAGAVGPVMPAAAKTIDLGAFDGSVDMPAGPGQS